MNKNRAFLLTCCLTVAFTLCACTKSGGGGEDSSGGGSGNRSDNPNSYTTDCGVSLNGQLVNPVALSMGALSSIASPGATPDLLTIIPYGAAPIAVKLHGLGPVVQGKDSAARQAYNNLRSKTWYFFDSGCVYSHGGVRAEVGAMVSSTGESLAETMVKSGLVLAGTTDPCGGDKIGVCLKALEGDEPITAGVLAGNRFQYKPRDRGSAPVQDFAGGNSFLAAIVFLYI